MHGVVLLREISSERDHLGQRQLDHAAGVRIGGIEDRDSLTRRCRKIDLVRPDAERSDCPERVRRFEYTLADLALRADSEHLHAVEALAELVLARCPIEAFDLESGLVE
jgi:hypothetical protein